MSDKSASAMDERAHVVALACKGFLDDEEGMRLHELARLQACRGPILEIGSYCGKSSIYLAAGARRGGGIVLCVDHHRGSEEHQPGEEYHDPDLFDDEIERMDSLPELRRNIARAGLEDCTVLVVSPSARFARVWSTPLGMLFIDGGHSAEAANADYEVWAPKLARDGVLAIHDLFPDPCAGGQAPIEVYRRALRCGDFEELPTVKTLGVLRRR